MYLGKDSQQSKTLTIPPHLKEDGVSLSKSMKFSAKIALKDSTLFPLEKNKMSASILKSVLAKHDEEMLSYLYPKLTKGERGINDKSDFLRKPFTFATYFGKSSIIKETQEIKNDKGYFYLNFSFYQSEIGIRALIAFINARSSKLSIKYNINSKVYEFEVLEVSMSSDDTFTENEAVRFKTVSPIIIFNDNKDKKDIFEKVSKSNKKEDKENLRGIIYPTLNNEQSQQIALSLLKDQIVRDVKNDLKIDISKTDIEITDLNFKSIGILLYERYIPCSDGLFTIKAPKCVLEYIASAGVGSKRSLGFGYVKKVCY